MNNKTERLNEIFGNAEFLGANKDLNNFEAVFAAVHAVDAEISEEELSEYLEVISTHMDNGEISEENLEGVAGGGGLALVLGVAAGITAVCTAVSGCYKVGTGIGEFIYNWKTRKSKK